MATWWMLAFAASVILIVGVVVLVAVRSRRGSGDPSPTLRIARFLAIAYAVLVVVGTTATVLQVLLEDAVRVTMPVRTFWPELFPNVEVEITHGPTAEVAGGGFEEAEVIVTGLDGTGRALLAAGHGLQGITMTLIAVAVALLCSRLLAGSPFRPVVSRSMTIAAAAIALGGTAWQVCFELAGTRAADQVLTVTGWTADADVLSDTDPIPEIGVVQPSFGFELEFWPLFLGLALAALAAAFRHGERLQRDTEGLV